jgi:hypothetical protein
MLAAALAPHIEANAGSKIGACEPLARVKRNERPPNTADKHLGRIPAGSRKKAFPS